MTPHAILLALYDGKKIRSQFWPKGHYIHYWNHIVLDQSGGLFDIVYNLVVTFKNDWEVIDQ